MQCCTGRFPHDTAGRYGDGFEGGYTIFDADSGNYCEIVAHPMSTAGSGPDASPLDPVLSLVPQLLSALRLRS